MSSGINHNKSAAIFFFIFCVLFLVESIVNWQDSYDTIGYVGAAKAFETKNKQVLHHFVFTELKKNVSEQSYKIFYNTPYRKAVFDSPEIYWQQLPYYRIRVVYSAMIFAAHKMGMDYLLPHAWLRHFRFSLVLSYSF